jgi:DNA-binding transcriptional regulator YdaS (Cro superfamily)
MTGPELLAALRGLGIDAPQRWLAERLGVNETTVWRWCSGATEVPKYASAYIELWREAKAPKDRRARPAC